MNIIIENTTRTETLSLIDPQSDMNCIIDFIGNAGALTDGQFNYDEARDAYVCSQETFDWWHAVVNDHQQLNNRLHALNTEHGTETVNQVIGTAGNVDLEDFAWSVNQALDTAFGSAE
ncbi:hypothetical protein [Pseudoalteromonas rubra]|uniref:hypothetical protein n=1 Tax=Pseudoalteromonas rubra TaxID=43658 RepID=UPI000F78D8E0|nr:hypothetical protein [Pseudoalteromonas rubra]